MKAAYRVLVVLLMALMVFMVVGCKPAPPVIEATAKPLVGEKSNRELQDGKPFRMMGANRQHPFYRMLELGFMEACVALDVLCEDSGYVGVDIAPMAGTVDIAIAQGTSGVITGVDTAYYASYNKLIAAGIPLISIHTRVPKGNVPGLIGWVAADNTDYAKRSADVIGDKIGGKGTVAITQNTLNDIENEVTRAFTAEMKEKYLDVVVLPAELEGSDPVAAIAVATAILQKYPDLAAAYGTTAYSPVTWGKAVQAVGQKPGDLVIIGMDYLEQNLDMVKAGWVYALVGQPVYEEAYRAVELLVAHLQGKPVEYENFYPAPIITVDAIDKYYGYAKRITSGE